ncbi:hypothetical protein GCM10011414_08250 [Croceivirga lutea]|uniref:RMD1 family protein n=1 Tax=Croceivirga lutea TaxID=1775167 RepID=UPI00163AA1FC|nr:RMD1 family protein [Croceivirga lutea]GGG41137.1 hypothetical protein GCM10011414_08250 [Croceivirga lutea]
MGFVKAYQIASSLSIRECKSKILYQLVFSDSNELFYRSNERGFVYIFQYGLIAFYEVSDNEINNVLQQVKPFARNVIDEPFFDSIELVLNHTEEKVAFEHVFLLDSDVEAIRLVMLHTSQSVALDRFDAITEDLLTSTNSHTSYLEQNGKLDIRGNKLKRFIGRTLNVKNLIAENLYIFDSPDMVWESERLNSLNQQLKQTFDLKDRHRYIHDRIAIVKDNLELFKDIMDHKESSRLEWIIIILILVEVLDHFIVRLI